MRCVGLRLLGGRGLRSRRYVSRGFQGAQHFGFDVFHELLENLRRDLGRGVGVVENIRHCVVDGLALGGLMGIQGRMSRV